MVSTCPLCLSDYEIPRDRNRLRFHTMFQRRGEEKIYATPYALPRLKCFRHEWGLAKLGKQARAEVSTTTAR